MRFKENGVTALPEDMKNSAGEPHLFTVAEYAELGESESGYTELQEGRILMSPSPSPNHNHASLRLAMQFVDQLPADLEVIQDVDIDLELVPYGDPGFSRRPDMVVIPRSARERVSDEGGMLKASEVVVVMEIVSPGSKRMDRVVKRGEYEDARGVAAGHVESRVVDGAPAVVRLANRFGNWWHHGIPELLVCLRVGHDNRQPVRKAHQPRAFGGRETSRSGSLLFDQDLGPVLVIAGRQGACDPIFIE